MSELTIGSNYKLEGDKLDVLKFPEPILKKIALPITDFNSDLAKIAKDMLYTMYKAPGIGLAAPQVGHSIRMFVIDIDFEKERVTAADGSERVEYSNFNPLVMINPEIISSEGEQIHQEGCLSFPGIFEDVKRFEKISIKYQNLSGKKIELDAEEMLSICMQHELDHLNGVVFIERLSQLKRTFILKKFAKKKKKRANR